MFFYCFFAKTEKEKKPAKQEKMQEKGWNCLENSMNKTRIFM